MSCRKTLVWQWSTTLTWMKRCRLKLSSRSKSRPIVPVVSQFASWLLFIVTLKNFFTDMDNLPMVTTSNLDLCMALSASFKFRPQHLRRFLSVPYLYCDMGHPFLWSHLMNPWPHTSCLVFGSGTVTICFNDLNLWSGQDLNHNLPLERQTL